MSVFVSDQRLGSSQYRLVAPAVARALVGERWLVREGTGGSKFCDMVQCETDEYLLALCTNALYLRSCTRSDFITNTIAAGWLSDGSYFQVFDLEVTRPDAAKRLSELPVFEALSAGSGYGGTSDTSDTNANGVVDKPSSCEREAGTPAGFARIAGQILNALIHLHKTDIVHGAVCPESIVVTAAGTRLSELWWCHSTNGRPFHKNLLPFYPQGLPPECALYLAPEVLLGQGPSPESDLYSLGALLFHGLTGVSVRNSDTRLQTADGVRSLRADLPVAMCRAIGLMLDDNPQNRGDVFLLKDLFAYAASSDSPGSLSRI